MERIEPPIVSVLVPAFNAAAHLGACLDSALAQTWPHLEVVVVDDGSVDDTAAIVEGYAARDNRVRLVRQANAGVAVARNRAFGESRGSLIAPLDADDVWHPTKIARQVQRLVQAGEAAAIVYCWSSEIDEWGRIGRRRLHLQDHEGDVYAPLVLYNFLDNSSTPLLRREALEAVGGWDPGLRAARAQGCEDWQLYLRLAERHDVVLVPEFLVGYRQSAASMSRALEQMRRSYALVMAEARCRHPELPARLFRWSRAAYLAYLANLCREDGRYGDAVRLGVMALLLDPAWLARRSVQRHMVGMARRLARRVLLSPASQAAQLRMEFQEVGTIPDATIDDGWVEARRLSFLAGVRVRRAGS